MPSVRDLLLQLCVLGVSTGLTAASNPLAAMGPDGSTGRASASSAAAAEPGIKRYLVAYASSITKAPRTASAITLVNDAGADCAVTVDFYTGFGPTLSACSLTAVIPGGFAYDFCTRDLPVNIKSFGIDIPNYLGVTVQPDITTRVTFNAKRSENHR